MSGWYIRKPAYISQNNNSDIESAESPISPIEKIHAVASFALIYCVIAGFTLVIAKFFA
jgi:hypothetical protein